MRGEQGGWGAVGGKYLGYNNNNKDILLQLELLARESSGGKVYSAGRRGQRGLSLLV